MILKIIIAFFPTIIQVVSYEIFHKKIMQSKKIDIKFIGLFFSIVFGISIISSILIEIPSFGDVISSIFHYIFLFIQPLIFYKYFLKRKEYDNYLNLFLSFVIYLSVETSETFLSVIISSITGDYFVKQHYDIFYIIINLLSLFIILVIYSNSYPIKYFSLVQRKCTS